MMMMSSFSSPYFYVFDFFTVVILRIPKPVFVTVAIIFIAWIIRHVAFPSSFLLVRMLVYLKYLHFIYMEWGCEKQE